MKKRQLSKPEWLYQTEDGTLFRMAESQAWMKMYYATYGWMKMWAGGVGAYPDKPIKYENLVKRAWENAQWLDDYDKNAGRFNGVKRDPTSMLQEALKAYQFLESITNYGQYVKSFKLGKDNL